MLVEEMTIGAVQAGGTPKIVPKCDVPGARVGGSWNSAH